jgi:hypothetical protein
MRGFHMTAVTAGLIGGTMLLFGAAPASALTIPNSAFATAGETSMVEQVQRRGGDRRARSYDRRRHGQRYSRPRAGHRHHYRGHYYASPWWLAAPAIGLGLGLAITPQYGHSYGYSGGRTAHVQWCYNRFRSYNAATDSYLGYDGRYHRCNSPY